MIGELTIDMARMPFRLQTTVVISYKYSTGLPKHFKFEVDDHIAGQRDELIREMERMVDVVWLGVPATKKEVENWFYGQPCRQLIRAVSSAPRRREQVQAAVAKDPEAEEEQVQAKLPRAKVVGGLVQGMFDSLFGSIP